MVRLVVVYSLLILPELVLGQKLITGQVQSARTGLGIGFASVGIRNQPRGTITDSTGRFRLQVATDTTELMVSAIGYQPAFVRTNQAALIRLDEMALYLTEVQVRAINPAHRIVQQAVVNLPQHDPERYSSFRYEGYHVLTVGREPPVGVLTTKPTPNTDLYVNESYSERQFMAPNLSHETIIGSRTSGTQSTLFTSLRPLLQSFGFHRETILVSLPMVSNESVTYLNPLSPNSEKVYDFFLRDTLIHAPGDSTFVIDFEPQRGRHITGFAGVMHIRSGSFALEYVLAEPADPATLLRFRFEQTYERVQGRWFPVDIRSDWTLHPTTLRLGTLRLQSRSLLTNIRLNVPMRADDFEELSVSIADGATRQSDAFWQTHRLDSLSVREQNTYRKHEQLRGWQRFVQQQLPTLGEWATSGIVPINRHLNLSSQTFFDANRYEGLRLTLNLLTSPAFSRIVRLDGKLAYGVLDRALKYEFRGRLLLNQPRRLWLTGAYRFDVSEPGNVQFFIWNHPQIPYELIRTFLLSRADSLRQYRAEVSFMAARYATVIIAASHETRQPTYAYRFLAPEHAGMPRQVFETNELSAGFRYAFNEKLAQIGQGSLVSEAPSPVWSLQVIYGLLHQPTGGAYSYMKLNTHYEQLLRFRRLGETYLNLTAGLIWGDLPYPFLYNGRGSRADGNLIWVANHFQTMGLYEFTSDRYATLFWTHNFRSLLARPRLRWFRPEPSVVQGVAYGSLRSADWHSGLAIKTLERGFFESGLVVDNLYRQQLAGVAYVGIGAGVFYRWGPNHLPHPTDNWACRLVWNVSF